MQDSNRFLNELLEGGGGVGAFRCSGNQGQRPIRHDSHKVVLTLSAPASLSVCKFFLHYPHQISCLIMSIK